MGSRIAFVVSPRSSIYRSGGTLKIRNEASADTVSLPVCSIRSLALYGASTITGPALELCIQSGIQIHLLTYSGRYLGSFANSHASDAQIRIAQYQRGTDPHCRILFARFFVLAKLRSFLYMLERWMRRSSETFSQVYLRIRSAQDELSAGEALTLEQILGIEGIATRTYFEALAQQIHSRFLAHFSFPCRTRRPPRDRFNALLSFLYTALLNDVSAALCLIGLDVQVGFLHTLGGNNKPALALDLMEEFRPWIVDRLALRLVNRGQLNPEQDFEINGSAVFLSKTGRKVVLTEYARLRDSKVSSQRPWRSYRIHQVLLHQAKKVRTAIERGEPAFYTPFAIR